MEVYIEFVFIENFIIDLLLLLSTSIITKNKLTKINLISASIFASAVSLCFPFLKVHSILIAILKLTTSLLIVITAFHPTKIKQLFLLDCVFLFLTFLLGGICVGIHFLGGNVSFSNNSVVWNTKIPLSIIVLSIFCFLYFGNQLLKYITRKSKLNNFFFDVSLFYNKICYNTVGYLDSANYVIDSKTNSPVILINEETFSCFFNKYEQEKQKAILDMHNIQIATLSNKNRQIPCFLLDKLVIYSKSQKYIHKNVTVAISPLSFNKKINAEVLLSPYLF